MQGGIGAVGRGERSEAAESVASLDEVESVPLERLLDQEFAAELLVERACRTIVRNDPDDERGRAWLALAAGTAVIAARYAPGTIPR